MEKPHETLIKIPVLQSSRLILKPLSKKFITQEYVNWMNDEEVIRFMNSGGDYTLKKLNDYIEKVEKNPIYFWAITTKNEKRHIGNIKIDPIDKVNRSGEYGIMIGNKNFQGKGFASEASRLVIEYCFKNLQLRKVNLGVLAKNKLAINLYKTLGFSIEGIFRKHLFHKGKFEDLFRMSTFNDFI